MMRSWQTARLRSGTSGAFVALAVAVLLSCVMFGSTPALAQSLNELRASGAVGEGFDGYARVRQGDAGARAVVDDTNAKRRKIYADRARNQGTTVDQVGLIYAKEIWSSAPSGTWVLDAQGAWSQK